MPCTFLDCALTHAAAFVILQSFDSARTLHWTAYWLVTVEDYVYTNAAIIRLIGCRKIMSLLDVMVKVSQRHILCHLALSKPISSTPK